MNHIKSLKLPNTLTLKHAMLADALLSVLYGNLAQVQRLKFSSKNRAHTRAELEEVAVEWLSILTCFDFFGIPKFFRDVGSSHFLTFSTEACHVPNSD